MRVVHCGKDRYTHYIGRPSPLGNPYAFGESSLPGVINVGNRGEAIQMFEKEVRASLHLITLIAALPADAILGCFCKPRACHGDVIVRIWKEIHE